jgi:hypothetical protein
VSARYRGKVRFDALDAAARTVHIVASGQETSGRGGADMKMQSRLVEKAPGETQVSISSEVSVTGILAQFGRGMIQDVSNQIFQKFSEAVRAELEQSASTAPPAAVASLPAPATTAPPPAGSPPIDIVSLGSKALGRAAIRSLARPVVWLSLLVVVLALYWLFYR